MPPDIFHFSFVHKEKKREKEIIIMRKGIKKCFLVNENIITSGCQGFFYF